MAAASATVAAGAAGAIITPTRTVAAVDGETTITASRAAGLKMGIMAKRHEHAGDDRPLGGLAPDPHSKRILLDLAEWYARLARLAKLREAPGEQQVPARPSKRGEQPVVKPDFEKRPAAPSVRCGPQVLL
jgi:hypothetical protein